MPNPNLKNRVIPTTAMEAVKSRLYSKFRRYYKAILLLMEAVK